jgi:hypothetical protein
MNENLDYKVYDSKAVMPYPREEDDIFTTQLSATRMSFTKPTRRKRGRPRKAKHLPYL